jgi:hypothetical protein
MAYGVHQSATNKLLVIPMNVYSVTAEVTISNSVTPTFHYF